MAKHKYGSAERERELERKPSHPPAN
jgi:hypothetical protein